MIYPRDAQVAQDVADHYDDLSRWYLELWGEHVHHGLWQTGHETADEAVTNIVDHLAEAVRLAPGARVVDIGCGYGATARRLADRFGVTVEGFTLSREQYEYARAKTGEKSNPRYRWQDWFDNDLPASSVDVAISVESSEHMVDKAEFFRSIYRVLKPGGRLAVYAWLSRESPRRWEIEHLLEPICREGRLPSMGTETDYRHLMSEAGFGELDYEDMSRRVGRTWPIIVSRMAKRGVRDPELRHFFRHGRNRVFMRTVLRIWAAYATSSMRYGLFVCRKPAGEQASAQADAGAGSRDRVRA